MVRRKICRVAKPPLPEKHCVSLFSGVGCSNDFHPENKPCFLGRDGQNSQHQKTYFLGEESSWRTTKGNRGFSQFFCADRTHLFWVGRVFPRTTTSLTGCAHKKQAGHVSERSSNGVMDDCSEKVQKAGTHASSFIVMYLAVVEIHL